MKWGRLPACGRLSIGLYERLRPFLSQQESSTEAIALCIALGVVLGVCPILGGPTVLCALAAAVLRLNLPAIQFINYLAYPLQLTLLWPFIRLGQWLFQSKPVSVALAHAHAWQTAYDLLKAGAHTVVAWFCVCAPVGWLLYLLLTRLLRCRPNQTGPVN